MGRYEIRIFWEDRPKRDAKFRKTIRALNKKVKHLNKKVKLLNEELAQADKRPPKPAKVVQSDLEPSNLLLFFQARQNEVSCDASDFLPNTTTYELVSEQHRKRKRTGSTNEGESGNDKHRPVVMRGDDLVTDRRSMYLESVDVNGRWTDSTIERRVPQRAPPYTFSS